MMKYLTMALVGLMMVSGTHKISSIERSGSWIYMYDDSGKKYQTLSANSVGEILGHSSTFSSLYPAAAVGSTSGIPKGRSTRP